MNIQIREGRKEDLPQALGLIKELAEYVGDLDQVKNTVEDMERDGFGSKPIFDFFVAESGGKVVGIAIYYFRYSTWKGRRIYLEDIVVTQSARGQGIGTLLMDRLVAHAKAEGCTGLMWSVYNHNTKAIEFYKKYGAAFEKNWISCHIDF